MGRTEGEYGLPVWVIGVGVVLTASLALGAAVVTHDLYRGFEDLVRTELRIRELTGEIQWLDEVLTMSARMGASTGDARWEERYRAYEPQLDAILKEAVALSPEEYLTASTAETDEANQRLVEMEHHAFDLVRRGEQAEAATVLFGGEYERQKAVYAKGMHQTMDAVARRAETQLEQERRLVTATGVGGLIGSVVLAGIWATIIRRLAWHVRVLTAEIESRRVVEEALERSRDEALQASRVKSDFVANMSHEIRTPMNGILGMTELLLRTTLSTRQRDYGLTILRSAESLLGVLNDILDFSKIEAGKLAIEPVPFNLRLTVEDIADLLSPRSAEKGLEFIVRYDPAAPARVVGDPGRIRQVVTNLVGNAIKFTERGHVLVEVRNLDQQDGRARLQVRVTDTGIGIAPDRLESVFERFVQADGSTTRKHGGTGLGLTICRRLAELMGGRVGAESASGVGSTFWLELTLPVDTSEPLPLVSTSDLQGRSVLVVDDNPVNCQVVLEQLGAVGMRCRAALSGREALRFLRQAYVDGEPFDLAILDHAMPEMDGVALANAITADPAIGGLRLVMLTSIGQRGEARELEAIGFLGYLQKPAREAQLLELVAAVLAVEPGRHSLITRYTLDEQRASPGRRPNLALPPLKGRRVLLVEDNEVNRLVAVDLLAELGCTVDVAVDGSEAVQKTSETGYDVVLMDCQMPVMDGWEATRAIRKREAGTPLHVSIVALTASAMAGERERCVAGGMDDYLSKPVSLAALAKAIARHCGELPPEPPPVDEPAIAVLDLLQGLTVTGGKVSLLRRVVDAFLSDAPNRIASLERSVTEFDAGTAQREAHTLKGAASNLGAERFRCAAARIEAAVQAGEIEGLEPQLVALRDAFDQVSAAARSVDWASL